MSRTDFEITRWNSLAEPRHIREILPALLATYALLDIDADETADEGCWNPVVVHAERAESILATC